MIDPRLIVDWVNALGALLLPVAILIIAAVFHRPIREWLKSADSVSVGPFELKREIREIADSSRRILKDTSRLQILIAESRAIEVEVFLSYPLLTDEQRARMQSNLDTLKQEIAHLRKDVQ